MNVVNPKETAMWKKREIANPKRRTGIAAAIAAMAAASVFSPQVMGQAKEIKVAVVAQRPALAASVSGS